MKEIQFTLCEMSLILSDLNKLVSKDLYTENYYKIS